MTHSVESFVEALRADGVEAGRREAAEIVRQAELRATAVVEAAQAEARRIVEDAERQGREAVERARTELALAARDTVARLHDSLNQALQRVLGRAVATAFDDMEFLKDLIRAVTKSYAEADATESQFLELNVAEPVRRKLVDWAIAALHQPPDGERMAVELHGSLLSAGFEYKVNGGTVEVTPESVVQQLSRLVSSQLGALLDGNLEPSGDGQA